MDRQPLYARIADRLAQDIASGRYAVGTVLPKEPDLAAQLQISRATLRAALSSLERRKLVSRRKNAGTRVESDRPLASTRIPPAMGRAIRILRSPTRYVPVETRRPGRLSSRATRRGR